MKKLGSSTAPNAQIGPAPPVSFIGLPAPALTSATVARLQADPGSEEAGAALAVSVAAAVALAAAPAAAAPVSMPQVSFMYATTCCSAACTFGDENIVMSAAVSLL